MGGHLEGRYRQVIPRAYYIGASFLVYFAMG